MSGETSKRQVLNLGAFKASFYLRRRKDSRFTQSLLLKLKKTKLIIKFFIPFYFIFMKLIPCHEFKFINMN